MNEEESATQCWYNFLTAVVLWDEIWSFHISKIYKWNDIFNNSDENILPFFQNSIHQVEATSIDSSLKKSYKKLSQGVSPHKRNMTERTIAYQLISSSLGVPFFAHPSRNNCFTFEAARMFSRLDILERVDKELLEYYEKINAELGRRLLNFNYPKLRLESVISSTSTSCAFILNNVCRINSFVIFCDSFCVFMNNTSIYYKPQMACFFYLNYGFQLPCSYIFVYHFNHSFLLKLIKAGKYRPLTCKLYVFIY